MAGQLAKVLRKMESDLAAGKSYSSGDAYSLSMLFERIGPGSLPEHFGLITKTLVNGSTTPSKHVDSLIGMLDTAMLLASLDANGEEHFEFSPTFAPTPDEREEMLRLCEEIRAIIVNGDSLSKPFKVRLLRRVSAMEIEISREAGQLDTILAGMSDVGEAFGKFGKDIKPLVDRFKEVTSLARSKSNDYAELPPPEEIRKLPPPEEK